MKGTSQNNDLATKPHLRPTITEEPVPRPAYWGPRLELLVVPVLVAVAAVSVTVSMGGIREYWVAISMIYAFVISVAYYTVFGVFS
jgi:hypothetical protein